MFNNNEQLKDIINDNTFPVIMYDFKMSERNLLSYKVDIYNVKQEYEPYCVFLYLGDHMSLTWGTATRKNGKIILSLKLKSNEFLQIINDKDFKNIVQFNEKYKNTVIYGTCTFKRSSCSGQTIFFNDNQSKIMYDYYLKIENVQYK